MDAALVSDPAVPVSVHGWTWTATLVATLNILGGGFLVALIRVWPALRKIAKEEGANLLLERAAEMKLMRKRIDRLEADLRATTHKLNNVTQCFEWLLDTIEFDPERAKEAAAKARAMRGQQMQAEATEKAAILGAQAGGSPAEPDD